MHPAKTRNEFLNLRVQGLSFACIGRRLGVSKPTLIAWNRQAQDVIASRIAGEQQRIEHELAASVGQQLVDLKRRHTALRQELFSRAMREIPTAALETLAGEFRQRIEHLESGNDVQPRSTPGAPAPSPASPNSLPPVPSPPDALQVPSDPAPQCSN